MMMRMSDPSSKSESELSDDEVGHFGRPACDARGPRLMPMCAVDWMAHQTPGDRIADRVLVNRCNESSV